MLEDAAEASRSNDDLARRFVEQCRATQTILPGVTIIERLCADALVVAERRIASRIAGRLVDAMRARLDALLTEDSGGSVTRFVWLRQFEVGQNSADMNRLLDRLEFLQGIGLDEAALAEVPPHRIARPCVPWPSCVEDQNGSATLAARMTGAACGKSRYCFICAKPSVRAMSGSPTLGGMAT